MKPDKETGVQSHMRWLTVGMLLVYYFLSMMDRQVMGMLVDPIKADLGVSDQQMGLLLGFSFAIFYTLCGLPMGWLVDTFARRRIVFFGVALWSLATMAGGLAANYVQLFLSRMMVGVGEATLTPSAYSIISDTFARRRVAFATSVYSLGALFGGGVAFGAGGLIVEFATHHGDLHVPVVGTISPWQLVLILAGLPGLLFSLAIFLVREPPRTGPAVAAKPAERVGWAALLHLMSKHPRYWFSLFATFSLMNMMLNAVVMWQPSHFSRYFEWSPAAYGPAVGLIIVGAAVPGSLFAGWMIDKGFATDRADAHLRYYAWTLVFSIPISVVGFLASQVWLFFLCVSVFFFFVAPFQGIAGAAIQVTTPNRLRGRMAALFLFVTNIFGLGTGPSIVPALSTYVTKDPERIGLALAVLVGVCGVLALGCAAWGRKGMQAAVRDFAPAS